MKPEPVACTLTAEELRQDADDLLPGLLARAEAVEWLADGVRMTFSAADGLHTRIAAVVERERRCCSFLRFTLNFSPGGGPTRLEVTGPPGTREAMGAVAAAGHADDDGRVRPVPPVP